MNVSVIIPVYQAEKFITRAVESALAHDEVKEIVLVEDGSKDNSLEICQALAEEHNRVYLYRHPGGVNKGAGATRNLALKMASQEYISFLDADDYMTERRFDKEKIIFSENPDADGVYGAIGTEYYDDVGAKKWESAGRDESHLTTVNKIIPPGDFFEYVVGFSNKDGYKGYFSIDGLTVKRSRLRSNQICFDETLRLHQDTFFIWHCAYYLKLFTGEYQKPVAMRGVHKDNRITNNRNINVSMSKIYERSIQWSKEAGLAAKYQKMFHGYYIFFSFKANPSIKSVFQLTQVLFFNKFYRRKVFDDLYRIYTTYIKKNK